MMEKTTKNCTVCGKEFIPCSTCGRKDIDESLLWRRTVCCAEHFCFHLPVVRYSRRKITAGEAYAEITLAAQTYGMPKLCESARAVIDEIFAIAERESPRTKAWGGEAACE